MESPQQFMELFLQEQARLSVSVDKLWRPFEDRFFEADYLALYLERRARRETNAEKILSIENAGDVAKVITSGPGGVIPRRFKRL